MNKIEFKEPLDDLFPVCGCYNLETRTVYVYCRDYKKQENFIKEVERIITHEILHAVIHSLISESATIGFDSISSLIYHWDETTYSMLY